MVTAALYQKFASGVEVGGRCIFSKKGGSSNTLEFGSKVPLDNQSILKVCLDVYIYTYKNGHLCTYTYIYTTCIYSCVCACCA